MLNLHVCYDSGTSIGAIKSFYASVSKLTQISLLTYQFLTVHKTEAYNEEY